MWECLARVELNSNGIILLLVTVESHFSRSLSERRSLWGVEQIIHERLSLTPTRLCGSAVNFNTRPAFQHTCVCGRPVEKVYK